MKRGVVYVVTKNPKFVLYAAASILSLRDSGYKGPISIFTDLAYFHFEGLKSKRIDIIQVTPPKDVTRPSRWVKTRLAFLSPYDETLYLDTDTVVLGSIEKIWEHLSKSSFAVCLDVNPTLANARHGTLAEYVYTIGRYPPSSLQYNCGVVLWRRSKSSLGLFKEWHKEWQRFNDIDQLAFIRAVQNTGITLSRLPEIYNWNESLPHHEKPVVYHCLHLKPKLNTHFSSLYKQSSILMGIEVPFSRKWIIKYILLSPANFLQRVMRWLVRLRLKKLAGRNFAHRYKNL